MGRLAADDMNEIGESLGIPLRQRILWHLSSNHYPPVHSAFAETAERAIELANAGDWDAELTMPNGLVRTVAFVVDGLHLESFLAADEEYE